MNQVFDPVAQYLVRYPMLQPLETDIRLATSVIVSQIQAGKKILLCGNGGSASDAQHIAGELVKGFLLRRPLSREQVEELEAVYPEEAQTLAASLQQGIPAISLNCNTAVMTAVANDNHPDTIFAQQVYALGQRGDVLLAISTSGNSANVLTAAKVARARGLKVVALTGKQGGLVSDHAHVTLRVPAEWTPAIQELHLPLYHCICAAVEQEIFGRSEKRSFNCDLPLPPSVIVFDFDGVFTDNRVYVLQDGSEAVACNRGDSLGTNALKKAGIHAFILSKETNPVVQARAEKIGMEVYGGCDDKAAFLRGYFAEHDLDPRRAIYVGNDINDLAAMKMVGGPVCPSDAHPEVRAVSVKTLSRPGGGGAVREICDLVTNLLEAESP